MLKSLSISNFTVFNSAELHFSPSLNVIIGENSTGKSHLMKLGYTLAACSNSVRSSKRQNKDEFQRQIADKLENVFKPESLGRLVSRQLGRNRCEIGVEFFSAEAGFNFSFSTNSSTEVKLASAPSNFLEAEPIFIPTRELLSIYPGFAAAYRQRELEFDETYYDLALALEAKPLRGKRSSFSSDLIDTLENIMQGKVIIENGRFYLQLEGEGKGKLEMHLVAEGIRKVAMITYLLINGALKNKGILFWDEPESNLNPRLIESMAKALVYLAHKGIQVIIATHSLFLLREFNMLLSQQEYKKMTGMFFALSKKDQGVNISMGKTLEEVDPIVSLDADINQTERYLLL